MSRSLPSDPVRHAAGLWPDGYAIDGPAGASTFTDLDRAVDLVAPALAGRGAGRGVRIVTPLADATAQALVVLSALRLGAVAAPVSPRLPQAGLEALLERVGPALRIEDAAFSEEAAGALRPVATEPPRISPPAGPRRRATLLLTSGSSGEPKAVVHRLSAHLVSASHVVRHVGLGPGDRWLATLPLHHVGGLAPVFRTLASGATWVIPDEPLSVAVLRRTRTTHVSVVSTQLLRLVEEGGRSPATLRRVLLGGGPTDPDVVRAAVRAGWPVVSTYGMTETASMVAATDPGDPEPLTAGRALGHARLVVGPDGGIRVRCSSLAEGFWESGKVRPLARRDGWYATGDRGTVDPSGRLGVAGRLDRVFVSGGENVRPEEIERRLLAIAGVRSAIVVPVPDREFGQRPVAFVEGSFRPEALDSELRKWLPPYLVPDAFLEMPADPGGAGVKPSPARLQELAIRFRAGD